MSHRLKWGLLSLSLIMMSALRVQAVNPHDDLRIEVRASPNFVVDSNVESPSTYAPRAAYICAKVYNDGDVDMTDVFVNIGDYTNNTPGIYPTRTHPTLVGTFSFTHEGGSAGTDDAVRYIGSLPAGEVATVYWLISYPNLDDNGDAVHGPSVKPDDDLYLFYDVWATAQAGATPLEAEVRKKATMRNEISARANKIWPNTASKVAPELKDAYGIYEPIWTNTTLMGEAGVPLTSSGIWFDLGNIEKGFDNDGFGGPDQNAWLQPVGDPSIFDSSAYRLIKTYATVWVSLIDGTLKRYDLEDDLYLTDIPKNNGAVGIVHYTFMPMTGGGGSALTPYQEVASGFDNEKFNGDYGTQIPVPPSTSRVDLVKDVDKAFAWAGETLSYTVDFTNTGDVAVGDPDLYVPLVVKDSVPTGTVYAGGAATGNTLPAGVTSYKVLYSTNSGVSWVTSEPATLADVTDLQWWLSDPLPTGASGRVTFQLDVEDPYTPATNLVVNTACLSFGSGAPFLCDDAVTLILGTNAVGDTVFLDDGSGVALSGDGKQDGGETGLVNIAVELYYDIDTDGELSSSDYYIGTTNTDVNGEYIFTNLPDGNFIVQVDEWDADLPVGSAVSTPRFYSVDLDSAGTNVSGVSYLKADFAFVPAVWLDKSIDGPVTNREGDSITYDIVVSNQLSGTAGRLIYRVWATNEVVQRKPWDSPENAYSSPDGPDGLWASNQLEAATDYLELIDFGLTENRGNVSNVYLVVHAYTEGQFTGNDELGIEIHESGTPLFVTNLLGSSISNTIFQSEYVFDVTTNRNWTWADFNTNTISIYLRGKKGAAPDPGTVFVDCGGFRVVSDWVAPTNNPSTTLRPVPLTDTYDADVIEYVSALPEPQSVTVTGTAPNSVGTIQWDDVGPLYPGSSEEITVNFTALEPFNNTLQEMTNIAYVDNVYYADGRPANSATDSVPTVILPAGVIGDYVWRDVNSDGVQDTNEFGIEGVSVICTPPAGVDIGNGAGSPVTNVTDRNGWYLFAGIPSNGTYVVEVDETTLPGGAGTCTYDEDDGTVSPDGTNTITGFDPLATDGSDTHDTSDFGYSVVATIEGTIWNDLNRNGAGPPPDPDEPWLTNVTVVLYDGGTPIDTNTTDASGYFQFTGSFNGTYTIQVSTNTGEMSSGTWTQSYDTDGLGSADQVSVTLPAGGYGRGDFSYYQTGSYDIGDTLFYDWNGDGTNNGGDRGVVNVSMHLYLDVNTNGTLDPDTDIKIMTDVTDTNGLYLFESLIPTNYIVEVDRHDSDMPDLFTFTADPTSPNDGISDLVIVAADNLDQDFGIQPWGSGSIGDTVWKDVVPDGIQSGGSETGIPSITVSLYWTNSGVTSLYATATTDATGWYLFEDLPDGTYIVMVDTNDTDLPVDSAGNKYYPTTQTEFLVGITNNSTYLDADFGFSSLGFIGDTIFWDANRNGEQDMSETGVVGVTVSLYIDNNTNGVQDGGDTLYGTEVTTTNGFYLFDGLPADDYVVVVTTNTGPLQGTELTADPSPENMDSQDGVSLPLGGRYYGADFGYVPNGIIGDTVWLDMDSDGLRSTGELGIAYVTVDLYDTGGFVTNTETDGDGWYMFMALPDNTYSVIVDTADADFPSGLTQTYDADGTLDDQTVGIVLSGGSMITVDGNSFTNHMGIDFGYRYTGSNDLSGTIGMDSPTTTNGLMGSGPSGYDADESPFVGETVYVSLWNDDGDNIPEAGELSLLGSTSTDTNGDYSFSGLPDGDGDDEYYVSYSPTEKDLTMTTLVSSRPVNVLSNGTDAAGNTIGAWQAVTIATNVTNVDFAFRLTENYDFGDLPASYGTRHQDGGAMHTVPGTPDLYLGATAPDTESNGQPSADADSDDTTGSDDEDGVVLLGNWSEGADGGSVEVTVGSGSGWLLGYIDFNNDGDMTDSGELVINQAVTNIVYTNTFTVPADTFAAGTSTVLYARFRLFEEEPEGAAEDWYKGMADNGEVEDYAFEFAALGDYVWYDLDAEGDQDAGELPMTNILVYIDENDDNTYQSTEPSGVTDTNGLYTIGGLMAGTYTVRVDTTTLPAAVFPSYDLDGTNTPHEAIAALSTGQYRDDFDYGYFYGYIDVGVGKVVDDASPSNGVVVYTMVITNYGPQVATGLKWIDNLPDGVVYYTNTTSTGTYDDVSGIWDVGTLAVDDTATLTITASMETNVAGQSITNWIYLNDLDQVDTNTNNNQDDAVIIPTYVILSRFEAMQDARGDVVIEWETSAESHTVGFYLVRKDAGTFTRVNDQLLPAIPGSPQGGIYSVIDPDAEPGKPVSYTLIEVEHTGVQNSYGPFTVTAPKTKPNGKSGEKENRGRKLALGKMTATAKSSPGYERRVARRNAQGPRKKDKPSGRKPNINSEKWAVKLVTGDAAPMSLSAEQISSLTGMKIEQAVERLLDQGLALTCRGAAVPYVVDADTATLYFYAEEYETTYTDRNAYLASRGSGLPMTVLPGEAPPQGAPVTYDETVHVEKDVYSLRRLITDPEADSWMWDFFIGGYPAYSRRSYTFATPGVAAGEASVVVRMQGASRTGVTGEHVVSITVNGIAVGTTSWTGLEALDFEIPLPSGLLVDGENTLEVNAAKGAGAPYSVTYLNEFDVTFPRALGAQGDIAVVRGAPGGALTVGGFDSDTIRVWDISDPARPVALAGVNAENGTVSFSAEAEHDYVAFGPQGTGSPLATDAVILDRLSSKTNEADYVVITVPEFSEAIGRLTEYRAGLGLKAKTVILEDIYNEFAYGIETPEAIKAFLAHAAKRWRVGPSYVVLGGEGTFDYKGHQGTGDNFVPPMLVKTARGMYASDNWFVDFDGDQVPEIPLGRLPGISSLEISNIVSKIIAYESGDDGDWQKRALLVADQRDSGGNFSGSSDLLAKRLPGDYLVNRAYLDNGTVEQTRSTLLGTLNSGAAFMNYFGHSGQDVLAHEGLLKSADVASLSNGSRLPVFMSLSCVAGRFDLPGFDCISEELLLKADGGCIAVWAPSGWSLNVLARELAEGFYDAIFQDGESVLGDAMMKAVRGYAAGPNDRETIVVYGLLGDPALRITGRAHTAYNAELGKFERWQQKWFANRDGGEDLLSSPEGDADGDGLSNLQEYLFGTNPRKADRKSVAGLSIGRDKKDDKPSQPYDMEVVYERNKHVPAENYVIETSEDLLTWRGDKIHIAETIVNDNNDGLTETVTVRIRARGKKRCFVRLRVQSGE